MGKDKDKPKPDKGPRCIAVAKIGWFACFWLTLLAVHAAVQTEIHQVLAPAPAAADTEDAAEAAETQPTTTPADAELADIPETLDRWFTFWRGAQAVLAPPAFVFAVALLAARVSAGVRIRALLALVPAAAAAFLMFYRECYLVLVP